MGDTVPMPTGLAERARRFYAENATPVAPRRAATVVLLRDAADGPEAFLVRRRATMAFASGMYAFPGGGVDPRDGAEPAAAASEWVGPDLLAWAALLGLPGQERLAREVVSAAIREMFEETGVLFDGPSETSLVTDVGSADWAAARQSLVQRRVSLSELLRARDLLARSDLLHAWARWITPEFEPRRYDTFFFLAEVPAGQTAREVGGEADTVCWLRPADALARQATGEWGMLPPTVAVLRSLAGFGRAADALAAPAPSLAPVLPRVEWAADGARLIL